VDFEQLVCYSQTIIIFILVIGYLINYQKSQNQIYVKKGIKCSKCGEQLLGSDPNYCSSCGHMNSHSKGSNLEK
tara:strand:+ start:509 stop:730 length:222 start_codon:yes stop_codon:yes gene_type:complete